MSYHDMDERTRKAYFAKLRKKNWVPLRFRGELSLGTMASAAVVSSPVLDSVLAEDLFCISTDITVQMRDHTGPEGPLEFGLAHGDYSVTEIKEYLDVSYVDPDKQIEKEHARRLVRMIGALSGLNASEAFNDGRKYRQKLKFTVGNAFNLDFWVANRDGGSLTTGTTVTFQGTLFGRWLR